MKNLITFFVLLLFAQLTQAQKDINELNKYKYVRVILTHYNDGGIDNLGIGGVIIKKLNENGITAYPDNQVNKDVFENPCIEVFCTYSSSWTDMAGADVKIEFTNCYRQKVYVTEAAAWLIANESVAYYMKSTEKAMKPFNRFEYKFNPDLAVKFEYPKVESTTETEESIKKYLSSSGKLDPIEGIYKTYKSDDLSTYYKIGIIKSEDKFKAIIIESEYKHWKQGEVKAYFEQSSMKGFYSVKWYMGNKMPVETFGMIESDAVLSIEFKDPKKDEKRQEKYIKMFPPATGDVSFKKDNSKASGSGFFLTTGGILATNAHVIEDANSIQVSVSNEIGTFNYKAKVLLVDKKNDVALIKIDDETFKGLTAIPYGISEKADVGEKVFTIGYPLNDVMGANYKVNDGIISSKSGISDDVRYYQISVPLQPGNSGGPLFDKAGNIIGITSAKLNGKAVGIEIENVNYAIKSSYLINLYNMLPDPIKLNSTSQASSKELQDQVKIFKNYVCLIKIF